MKTKHKILFAKFISKIITFIYKNKVLVRRNSINWFLDLNEGIDLSIFLFGKFENSILFCLCSQKVCRRTVEIETLDMWDF